MHSSRPSAFPVFIFGLALVVACGSSSPSAFDDPGSGGDAGAGGTDSGGLSFGDGAVADAGAQGQACDRDEQCGAGGLCDLATHTCGCGGTAVGAQPIAPNILVVQDRSCSMTGMVGSQTKWQIAVGALDKMTMDLHGKVRFGLSLFPDQTGDQCTQDALTVAIGDNADVQVRSILDASLKTTDPLYPSQGPCVTNIDTAMEGAAADPGLADPAHGGSVILITDGSQAKCSAGGGNAGTVKAIGDLLAKGVGTYVIGFGAGVNTAALDSFAAAGGRVNAAGPHQYYDASDTASLDATLAAIGKSASLTCDLQLSADPPNGDVGLLYVYLDKTPPPVPRDTSHKDGWDYDAATKTVHFYGSACTKLKSGTVTSESVVFGCPGGGAPPPR